MGKAPASMVVRMPPIAATVPPPRAPGRRLLAAGYALP
jgi:hypothetical protein